MRKQVIYCDKCNKENAHEFDFIVDREMDGAGSMDNVHDSFDLCPDCAMSQLKLLLDALDWDTRKRVCSTVKQKKFFLADMNTSQRKTGGLLTLK